MSTHQEVQIVSCTVCRRVKEPRVKVVVSMVFGTTVGKTAKVGQLERDGQMARVLEFFRQRLGAPKASRNEQFGARLDAEGVRCSCDGGVDS